MSLSSDVGVMSMIERRVVEGLGLMLLRDFKVLHVTVDVGVMRMRGRRVVEGLGLMLASSPCYVEMFIHKVPHIF